MMALALSACGGGGSGSVTPAPVAANAGGGAAPSTSATASPAASSGGPAGNITTIGIPAVQPSYAPSNGVALTSNVIDGGAGNYSTIATTNGGTATASCADPADATTVRCFTYLFNKPSLTATPSTTGLTPANFLTYYGIASAAAANGTGVTIAIVDAYDAPNITADMATYRSTYGISSGTLNIICQQGTASGTFTAGRTPCIPACATGSGSSGCTAGSISSANTLRTAWATEISLDVEMVSAICPKCTILLVEAATSSATDMGMATLYAANNGGAQYISGSYGGTEAIADLALESTYYAPAATKAALFVATGDKGFAGGRSYPATSPSVIAVGGTTLTPTTTAISGFNETSWSGSGDGCSAYFTKVTLQSVALCGAARTVADVSADAGYAINICNSGIGSATTTCWSTVGGTSAATPIVASMYALANGTSGVVTSTNASSPVQATLYTRPDALTDIYKGADNGSCGSICDPAQGFDGVTGVGSPHGLGALTSGTSAWYSVPFITGLTVSDIAIGGSTPSLWAIGSNYAVYQYRNVAANEWGQPAALPTSVKAIRVAVEPSTGNPWIIASTGQVYRGSTNTASGMTWTAITASKKTAVMTDIAIAGSSPVAVYTVDSTGQLYSYSIGVSSTLSALSPQPSGGCCTGSSATHIAADPNSSQLWIVNTKGQIWGSSGNPPTSFSQLQPGLATDLAIGSSATAYVVGADLSLWLTTNTSGAATYSWLRGSVSRVAVDGNSGGNVWVLESNNSALYVNSSTLSP
jgi:subtilase family serine protease